MKKRLFGLVCLLIAATNTFADSHWTVNPHGFQYDMTIYVALQGKNADYGDCEVAAFCGDECRGVSKMLTMTDDSKVLYLRIYSNESQGETMTLQAYIPSKNEVVKLAGKVAFVANALSGTPGEPTLFSLAGDANGDGDVNVTDIMAVANWILNIPMNTFYKVAADVTGDNDINVTDIMGIANIILKSVPTQPSGRRAQ